jgi:tetratricopeptide (TPR) repeat protein
MKIKQLLLIPFLGATLICSAQSLPEILRNGNTKLAAMDYAGAEKDFANAIKLNTTVVDAYLDKMKKYGSLNEYQRSTSDMPDGFIYNHELAVPYYGHGQALEGAGRSEEALADYEKAVSIDPKYAEALCQKGVILIAKGSKDKGCMDLRKAKTLGNEKAKELYMNNECSKVSATFLSNGNAKFEAKDYAGALADYTAAVQLNSDSAEAYIKRAQCHSAMKKYDKAVSDYNKALKINPDTLQYMYMRGLAYLGAGNYKLAFTDFSAVVRKNPNHYEAYMQRGAACEGMENFKSASYDYSEAIRIKPKDPVAYYKRGIANQDAKDNSACKDFKMAASLGYEEAKALAEGCNPPPAK